MPTHLLKRGCGCRETVAMSEGRKPDQKGAADLLCVKCAPIGQRQRLRTDEPQERPNFEPTLDKPRRLA